jgi:uncharacterized membrane protein YeiH
MAENRPPCPSSREIGAKSKPRGDSVAPFVNDDSRLPVSDARSKGLCGGWPKVALVTRGRRSQVEIELVNVPLYLELSSVIVGSLDGASHAIRRRYDVIGLMTIGIIGGIGGTMLRDIILSDGPPLALRKSVYLLTAVVSTLVGLLFHKIEHRMQWIVWLLDTLTLGIFTVAGMDRAIGIGLPQSSALLVGVITGVGGSFIRDVVSRDVPALLVPGKPYATASLFGGLVYLLTNQFSVPDPVLHWMPVMGVIALRAIANWRKWTMPDIDDVIRFVHRIARRPRV